LLRHVLPPSTDLQKLATGCSVGTRGSEVLPTTATRNRNARIEERVPCDGLLVLSPWDSLVL